MTIIFFIVGAPLFFLGLLVILAQRKAAGTFTPAEGQIAGYVSEPGERSEMFYPVVQFTHQGVTYLTKSSMGSNQIGYLLGQSVKVFVNLESPPRAALELKGFRMIAWIFMLVGAALMSVSVATFSFNLFSVVPALIILAHVAWKFRKVELSKGKLGALKAEIDRHVYKEIFIADQFEEKFKMIDSAKIAVVRRQHFRQARFAGVIMLVISLGGVWASYQWHEKRQSFLLSAKSTSGVVVKLQRSNDSDGTIYHPVVKYRHPASESPVEFKHNFGSSSPSYSINDKVKVLYSETDPKSAMIDGGFWNLGIPRICIAVSSLLALLGLSLVSKREDPAPNSLLSPRR